MYSNKIVYADYIVEYSNDCILIVHKHEVENKK